MTQSSNQTPEQRAARAAAAEQMAAKAVIHNKTGGFAAGRQPKTYPSYNVLIVIAIVLAALGSFLALVWRSP